MPLQGISQVRKAPKFNELRWPVALVRSLRAPNDDWGFDERIRPYWTGWAKWEPGVGRFLEAGSEEMISDVYTIRWHVGIQLRDFDFLVMDKRFFKVQGSVLIGQTIYYKQLHCSEYHTTRADADMNVVTDPTQVTTGDARGDTSVSPPAEGGMPLFWPPGGV